MQPERSLLQWAGLLDEADAEAANDVIEEQDAPAEEKLSPPSVTGRHLDERLVECMGRIAEGDEAAMEELYRLTVQRIHATVLPITRTREMAEEAVSDAYFQLWRSVRAYDPRRGSVMAFLVTMARSRALDHVRRRDPAMSVDRFYEGTEPEAGSTPETLLETRQEQAVIRHAIAGLPALPRQLLSLAYLQGLSHREIGRHLGMPLGTVKTVIRRTLLDLRRVIEGRPPRKKRPRS